ncbi:MAG: hypothetical protein Q8P24_17175 [Desulfobacterales bacterium]|nr:hypothetical protein [Desulfobacterales bacterium]
MKHNNNMSAYLIVFILVLIVFSQTALAYTLLLETTSNGATVKTKFIKGDDLYLNILVDNPKNIAAAAFSLNYSTGILTPPATSSDGTPATAGEITSIFPFSFVKDSTETQTHRANSSVPGKIYFSGAAINTTEGGAKYTSDGNAAVMLTVKFKVKTDAIPGTFQLSLTQTELFNPAAGYGTDSDNDKEFDEGVDTTDKVPILVGAVAKGQPGFDNFDCAKPPCAFPVLLGDSANPLGTTKTSFSVVEQDSDLALTSGWNLVSSKIGIIAGQVFSDSTKFASVWIWQNTKWAVYLPDEDPQGAYAGAKGFGILSNISPGEGFWINSTASRNVTIAGSEEPSSSISLTTGWNLKGIRQSAPIAAGSVFADSQKYSSIWVWKNNNWTVYLPGEDPQGAYAKNKGFGALSFIEAGYGFWVNVTGTGAGELVISP